MPGHNPIQEVTVGCIIICSMQSVIENWLVCDGSAINRSTYERLFSALGTRFGTGNGSTTFNLPAMVAPGSNLVYIVYTGL